MYIEVGDGHRLYATTVGEATAAGTAVFLHGGPGGASSSAHSRFFPPNVRLVRFDQRGCGRSRFVSKLRNNTTRHLVADLELLRSHLGIDRWLIFGGSWGSTLGLCYAISHPKRVSGMVLRGVFLGSDEEWEWTFAATTTFRPRLAEKLRQFGTVTQLERRILRGDATAARAWGAYERSLSTLRPRPFRLPAKVPNSPLLECHYHRHKFFLESQDWILRNIKEIKRIPAIIVQGRYDLVCPPITAHKLAKAWGPSCRLRLTVAGHDAFEEQTAEGLKRAVRELI